MNKKNICLLFMILTYLNISAQWQQEWTSPSSSSLLYAGWIGLKQNDSNWDYKYYVINESSLIIMDNYYSSAPLYQYNFTEAEILGGYMIYSLGVDLTGDNIVEFYVLSYYGTAEPYRQSFKILDITNGQILLEKNNSNYYYSYPEIWDVDADGVLECSYSIWDYPNFASYNYEVYSTGISTSISAGNRVPLSFDLKQNYPNPFNPSTNIDFEVKKGQHVSLNVYDILGRKISTILNRLIPPGTHSIKFNGGNLSSGTYFYQLKTNEGTKTKKMSIIK